jgi:hypothetical protein
MMMYPSEQSPHAQGEELSDDEIARLRKKANILTTSTERILR